MKRTMLTLATLSAFAGGASAQSPTFTLYGRVDLSVGKAIGSDQKYLADGSSSRLGLRGSEDLGGGLKAIFNIEHRFEADTGANGNGISGSSAPGPRFWFGRSVVGLEGGWGSVTMGREYTPSFSLARVRSTPFGYDYVVSRNGIPSVLGLGIAVTRLDSAVTYRGKFGKVEVGAQVAEATDSLAQTPNKPVTMALTYSDGPLYAALGYELTGAEAAEKAKLLNLLAAWDFGAVRLSGAYITGNTAAGDDRHGWMLSASVPVGGGELRASHGLRKVSDGQLTDTKVLALGYNYNLSKRTSVYADVIHNSEWASEKSGYDFGIRHNF